MPSQTEAPSKTETAILAFVKALQKKASDNDALPDPLRNDDLPARMVNAAAGLALYLNVLDGERIPPEEMLGADLDTTEAYDIEHHVSVEWGVSGSESAAREAAFDRGRTAIWDALKADISSGAPVYLGGAVDGLRLVDIIAQHATSVAGLPSIKACVFVFAISFTSVNPF